MLQERRSQLVESNGMMSTVTPLIEPAVASRAGADLRAARERLGWSLADVAAALRIRKPHLEALEEGRLSTLPGAAYALAFVRTYARALGLDAEETVRRFKTEIGEAGNPTKLVFPAPVPERGLPAGAVMLLGALLAVGAYVGWYRLSAEGRLPAETVVAIPERLAPLAEQALPPVQPFAVAETPATARAEPSSAADAAPSPVAPPSISPSSAAAASIPREVASPAPATALAPALPAADEPRLVLRANAVAWLMVKDKTGAILLNRTMKAGETWPVPARPDLLLTTGNAGGTDILLDGMVTPAVGASGTVRRDMPLDIDTVKAGKLAAALAPQIASAKPRPVAPQQ